MSGERYGSSWTQSSGKLRFATAKDVVGDPETVVVLSAPSSLTIDLLEVDMDLGSETTILMSPYLAFFDASIGIAVRV